MTCQVIVVIDSLHSNVIAKLAHVGIYAGKAILRAIAHSVDRLNDTTSLPKHLTHISTDSGHTVSSSLLANHSRSGSSNGISTKLTTHATTAPTKTAAVPTEAENAGHNDKRNDVREIVKTGAVAAATAEETAQPTEGRARIVVECIAHCCL